MCVCDSKNLTFELKPQNRRRKGGRRGEAEEEEREGRERAGCKRGRKVKRKGKGGAEGGRGEEGRRQSGLGGGEVEKRRQKRVSFCIEEDQVEGTWFNHQNARDWTVCV